MTAFAAAALLLMPVALAWRSEKLAILAPKALDGPIRWVGDREAACRMLMIGDSHIARWPLAARDGWQVGKLGFSGQAAVNFLGPGRRALSETRPDVVVIAAGGNDATAAALQLGGHEATLRKAADAVDTLIGAAQSSGARQVIVLSLVPPRRPSLPNRIVYGARQGANMAAVSRHLVAAAQRRKVTLLDAAALARASDGSWRTDLKSDAIHWSAKGYGVLDAALWRLIEDCQPAVSR